MEGEITEAEFMAFMNEKHNIEKAELLDRLIKYLRHIEKEHIEGNGEFSGIVILNQMLSQGVIKLSLYLQIREAVKRYKTPYQIS